ncbi:MAG TPA: hypothetical protein VN238_21020 [Solirubrobacteraceae bacterium]|nr:hypothetical protein [Solirubrobacteraceae bacterium]
MSDHPLKRLRHALFPPNRALFNEEERRIAEYLRTEGRERLARGEPLNVRQFLERDAEARARAR